MPTLITLTVSVSEEIHKATSEEEWEIILETLKDDFQERADDVSATFDVNLELSFE